jgi:hypothetical protein
MMANTKNAYGHDPDGLKLINKPLQMIFPFTLNSLSSSINCLQTLHMHLHLALCLHPAEKDERVKTPVAPADTANQSPCHCNQLLGMRKEAGAPGTSHQFKITLKQTDSRAHNEGQFTGEADDTASTRTCLK